jgi:hypothetical protein
VFTYPPLPFPFGEIDVNLLYMSICIPKLEYFHHLI